MNKPYRIEHKRGKKSDLDWIGEYATTLDTFFYVDDADAEDPANGRPIGEEHLAGSLIIPPCQGHYLVLGKASLRADLYDDPKGHSKPVGVQVKAELLVGAYRLSPGLDPETPELTKALRSNNPGMPVHPSAVSLVNRDLARVHLVRHKDDPGADLMTVGLNVVTMPTGDPMDFDGGNWLRIDVRLEAEADEDSAFDLSVHGVRITATALSWAHGGPYLPKPW